MGDFTYVILSNAYGEKNERKIGEHFYPDILQLRK